MHSSSTQHPFPSGRLQRIVHALQEECSKVFGPPADEIAPETTFIAMGADSLALLRMSHAVQERLGVKVPFRRLMTDLTSTSALAAFMESQMPDEKEQAPPAPNSPAAEIQQPAAIETRGAEEPLEIKNLFRQQLRVISMQLELLRRHAGPAWESLETGNGNHQSRVMPSLSSITGEKRGHRDQARPERESDPRNWMYAPSWMRSYLPPEASSQALRFLLFADECGLGDELARQLRSEGHDVLLVAGGKEFARLSDDQWRMAEVREDYSKLMTDIAGRMPTHILHMRSFDRQEKTAGEASFHHYRSLIFLAQSLHEARAAAQLIVVSNRLHDVLGQGRNDPAKAVILGPCAAIPKELPSLSCRSIDFEMDGKSPDSYRSAVRQLRSEILLQAPEPKVAYALGHRWVPCFEQIRIPAANRPPLRKNGVYLITGGLGGVGLCIAEHLARNYDARLVLTGRNAQPNDPRAERLRSSGAEVLVLAADVTSVPEMSAVVAQARRRFGPLHGVIHAAGNADGKLLAFQSGKEFPVLKPKILGTLALEKVFDHESLDFMVLCSSLASVVGAVGRAEYISANAFLDAYACAATATTQHKMLAINWDAWRNIGMDARSSALSQVQSEIDETYGMSSAEALQSLETALASGLPQVIVSTCDLPALYRRSMETGIDLLDSLSVTENSDPEPDVLPSLEKAIPNV